jgi:hypothetical protein
MFEMFNVFVRRKEGRSNNYETSVLLFNAQWMIRWLPESRTTHIRGDTPCGVPVVNDLHWE